MTPNQQNELTSVVAQLRGTALTAGLSLLASLHEQAVPFEQAKRRLEDYIVEILGPETEDVTDHIFHCPHCENDNEWMGASIEVRGHETASIRAEMVHNAATETSLESQRLDWERGDMDFAPSATKEWDCLSCGHSLTFAEMKGGLRPRTRTLQRRGRGIATYRHQIFTPPDRIQGGQIQANEEIYKVLEGHNTDHRHTGEQIPEAFSPEVISEYIRQRDPYAYSLTAECTSCNHSFMIGPEDADLICPKCDHEFRVNPRQKFKDPQNAEERRRRYAAGFGTAANEQ